METVSVIFDSIKNSLCIMCGAGFSTARAGKLYCSTKCKQFAYYHKTEIVTLKEARKGISDGVVQLKLCEYEDYSMSVHLIDELKDLIKRQNSEYYSFDQEHRIRLAELESLIPDNLKAVYARKLSIGEWSFLKVLYPHLCKNDFIKLLSSLERSFFNNMELIEESKNIPKNPVRLLYNKHIEKLAEGKISFV